MKLSIKLTPDMRIRMMHAQTIEIDVPISVSVPEGWKLVPVEPTQEMCANATLKAAIKYRCHDAYRRVYRAMLAAAPKPDGSAI
jgi:chorismate mutase